MNAAAKVLPWIDQPSSSHFAQCYDSLEFLIASLEEYVRQGIENNEGLLIIATEDTWVALLNALRASRINAAEMFSTGQLTYLDAEKVVRDINTVYGPDRDLFHQVVTAELEALQQKFRNLRCYGDTVNVLCAQDRGEDALILESYWNEYLHTHTNITLMCGYDNAHLKTGKSHKLIEQIYRAHANMIPNEKIDTAVANPDALKRLGALEQKVIDLTLALRESKAREYHLEETLRGFINIEKFASLNQICLLLAHKMRNPLQILKSSSEQILRYSSEEIGLDAKAIQNGVKRMESATDLITELVQNILETLNRSK